MEWRLYPHSMQRCREAEASVFVERPKMVLMLGGVVNVVLHRVLHIRIFRVRRFWMLYRMMLGGKCRGTEAHRKDHRQKRGGGELLHGPNVARTPAG